MTEPSPQMKQLEQASEDCRRQLEANPDNAGALHRLGLVARDTGQPEEAIELMLRSLQIDGDNLAGICDLAGILQSMGRLEESADFYRAALEAAPRHAEIHVKLGQVLAAAGHWAEAVKCHEKAVKVDARSISAHCNLGVAYQSLGELTMALASYRQAKRLCPDSEQITVNLGGCLLQLGRHEEAIQVLSGGVRKHPHSSQAYSNLAAACTAVGRLEEAISAAWKAVELDRHSANALNNLGNALKAQGEYAQAIQCFMKARQLLPDCYIAYNNLGTTLSEIGRSSDALEGLRRACALSPNNPSVFSNYLLTLNYQQTAPRATILAEHRRFDTLFAQPLAEFHEPHENTAEPQRRLRIGYVSADLRDHPVANFVEPIFTAHSTQDFDVFCYANQSVNDAVTERLRQRVPQWRNVVNLTHAELAAQIRRDRIDILVDLSGHTAGNRLLTFAHKPAPVQVSMIGYMQTTGLSAMDYRITDEQIDPSGISDPYNTEKLVRLTNGAAPFRPPVDSPEVNALPALAGGGITFASFNNLAKVTPETLATWAKLLHAVPNARLLLVGRPGHSLAEDFAAHGIPAERLEILGRRPMRAYLELHHRVDVLLDTFPYNGGTTSLIAAWMGVPMVSLAGLDPASRTGASLLAALGLNELIATDTDDYVRRATDAVTDLSRLATWRMALRGRLTSLLGGGVDFTKEYEAALRRMWCHWCEGRC